MLSLLQQAEQLKYKTKIWYNNNSKKKDEIEEDPIPV